VIKNRLGKRSESKSLWQEACDRYEQADLPVGVAEAAANLAGISLDEGDLDSAKLWLDKADLAANAAADRDTNKMMDVLRERYRNESLQ
jgi:hypothetical protein